MAHQLMKKNIILNVCFFASCFIISTSCSTSFTDHNNISDTIFKPNEVTIKYKYRTDSISRPTVLEISVLRITDSMVFNVYPYTLLLKYDTIIQKYLNYPRFVLKDSVDYELKHYSFSNKVIIMDIYLYSDGDSYSIPVMSIDSKNNLRFKIGSSVISGNEFRTSPIRIRMKIFIPQNFKPEKLIFNDVE